MNKIQAVKLCMIDFIYDMVWKLIDILEYKRKAVLRRG